MPEKIRVLKVERSRMGHYYVDALGGVVGELEIILSEGEIGAGVFISAAEMTREEYDNLPEFAGW